MFGKILIANRGEIACRIIRTCRRLGIRSVAVYSQADADARHVRLADEAYCVGPAASKDSYLQVRNILDAARRSGAEAIHPGYGFLSENEGFARACAEAGVVFIGPPVAAIQAMGSKSAAKALMHAAGVPLVPGYHGDEQDPALLQAKADEIGYPVLIKASAGGGGKGMRVVEGSGEFAAALVSCQREARTSFGDEQVLIEKYLQQPRHIEIQVFGDSQGSVISLHERDCSAQRRHQKVVEEAPAPGIDGEQRAAMAKAACDAARAVRYVGAGTVEFIADSSGQFYFMEMNTRLQVEHPVTEMITGLDLVEWQLRIAAGEVLPLRQDQVPLHGHSIEVRLYAEEPEKGFLPSIGRLALFRTPQESAHVRIDTGVEQGDEVGPYYDPMLAKLVVWDEDRERAIDRMLRALAEFEVAGVGNNRRSLARLVDHAEFRAGRVDTGLIERERASLLAPAAPPPCEGFELAALRHLLEETRLSAAAAARSPDRYSPWAQADGWRLNGLLRRKMEFACDDQNHHAVTVEYALAGYRIDGDASSACIDADGMLRARVGGRCFHGRVVVLEEGLQIFLNGAAHLLSLVDPLAHAGEGQETHGGLLAPMPGKILALSAELGVVVDKGTPLVVMEAMKMEHTLSAPARGTVKAYLCSAGEQVADGAELVEFEPAE